MTSKSLFSGVGHVVPPQMKLAQSYSNDALTKMLTDEESRSYFTSVVGKKVEITNEGVKNYVLDKLYSIVTRKISKMDVEYQEIMKNAGDYPHYRHFKTLDSTVKSLVELVKTPEMNCQQPNIDQLNELFKCHTNLIRTTNDFKDAFKFNVGVVKQYYLTVVSSLVYALGYVVTSMIDYEQRDGNVNYSIVFKNENILERGLPKNMMEIIMQFNSDAEKNIIKKSVAAMKNTKVTKESGSVAYEEGILIAAGILIGVISLPALIRYAIYFFMHTKIKMAEYFEAQANFLELNIRRVQNSDMKNRDKIIKTQQKYVDNLRKIAAKISGDKYVAEKEAIKEIEQEDKIVVKQSDDEMKQAQQNNDDVFNNSDILL